MFVLLLSYLYEVKIIWTILNAKKKFLFTATLINNWQEFRNDNEVPVTTTEPMISEHMDQFRCQCESEVPDRGEYYNKIFEGYVRYTKLNL